MCYFGNNADLQEGVYAVNERRVAVIGGGISGLSAAYYLQQLGKQKGIALQITIIEKDSRFGGKIETMRKDGFTIEKGPDSFLARKLSVVELAASLGLTDRLVPMNPGAGKNYILHRGKLQQMPPGLMLGIPTQVRPFMTTPLLSVKGKLRAGLDLVLPRRMEQSDESLGHFIERRLGREVLESITEPLLAGIYAGDTHSLSLQATFPQFAEMEREYRSLVMGMMLSKKKAAAAGVEAKARAGSSSAWKALPEQLRKSMFLTFEGGLATLVERLEWVLEAEGTRLVRSRSVNSIDREPEGSYTIQLEDGETMKADGVVLAVPAYESGRLVSDVPELQRACSIPYVSVANVALAFDAEDIKKQGGASVKAFDGTGFLVPRREGRLITACTWTSVKWLNSAPKGKVLLRMYVGRQGMEGAVDLSDGELLEGVKRDLRNVAGIHAEPEWHEITRWRRSMPQYTPGHIERLEAARQALRERKPGLAVCGAGFDGVGVPDCIRQGKQAAQQLVDYLSARAST
jgi:protoporphyrinogen/coproporphyrinogen III oxidase